MTNAKPWIVSDWSNTSLDASIKNSELRQVLNKTLTRAEKQK